VCGERQVEVVVQVVCVEGAWCRCGAGAVCVCASAVNACTSIGVGSVCACSGVECGGA